MDEEITFSDTINIESNRLQVSLDKTGKFCIEVFSTWDTYHYAIVYLTDNQVCDLMRWLDEAIVKKRGFI